jgi:RNA polymerase sigma-70 factor
LAIDQDLLLRTLLAERNKLLGYIGAIIPDEHLAEDIFQEVSVAAVRKQDQIQSAAHLMGWLRKAARVSALEMRRNRGVHPMVFDTAVLDALEGQWQSEDRESSSDQIEMLRKCLQKLGGYPRQLIELRYGEGISGAALAERVDRKVQTVYVALSRAHRSLALCVENGLKSIEVSG